MANSNNEKGGLNKLKIIGIAALIILAFLGFMFLRMKWRQFKASANFTMWCVLIIVVIILVIFLIIRSKINKSKKEKESKDE